MDLGEQKALADIDRYGCHMIHVAAEADLPPFRIRSASGSHPDGLRLS
jgi:hypothetical protein